MKPAFFLFLLLLLAPGPGVAQRDSGNPGKNPVNLPDPQFGRRRNDVPADERLERERSKQLNKERQAAIRRDTDKLLELATELKHYVDKSNENVLSLDVVRKADQIEKLAHSVKEKMKD